MNVARDQLKSIVERVEQDIISWRYLESQGCVDVNLTSDAVKIVGRAYKNCLNMSARNTNRAFLLVASHLGISYEAAKSAMQMYMLEGDTRLKTRTFLETTGFVYVVGCPNALENKNVVKIGFSKKPSKRIKQLQNHYNNPHLQILNMLPALMIHEHEIHSVLFESALGGEWFDLSDDTYSVLVGELVQ